jgi:hypothetical protein
LDVYGVPLRFVRFASYNEAHPDEDWHAGEMCPSCAWGERPDTGERVLLWLAGGIDWVVSRNSPDADRHRDELTRLGRRAA